MKKGFLHIISIVTIFVLACSWLGANITLPNCETEITECGKSCAENIPCCNGELVQFHSEIAEAYRSSKVQTHFVFFSILKVSVYPVVPFTAVKIQELPSPLLKAIQTPIYKQFQNFRL